MSHVLGSVGSYISYGWKHAKENFGQYWLALVIVGLIQVVLSALSSSQGVTTTIDDANMLRESFTAVGLVLQILSIVVGVIIGIGMVKMGFSALKKRNFTVRDMFVHSANQVWKYIGAGLLLFVVMAGVGIFVTLVGSAIFAALSAVLGEMGMIVVGVLGVIAFFVGIYYILRISLLLYRVVVDHADTMGVWEMIKHSYHLSHGHMWKIIGVGFLSALINILGALALFVGLLWTIPLSQIAMAKLYRDIDANYHKKDHKIKGPNDEMEIAIEDDEE